MKYLMALAALVAVVSGQYDYPGASRQSNGGTKPVYGPPQHEFEESQPHQPEQPAQQAEAYTPQVFRHVYVHAAPDEPVDEQARTIKVPGGDKHVNIIFVKTPSQSSASQTEVILPEQDEHKNLVYVLLKKGEASSDIKIRRPQAQRPTQPEVYFIRYKDQEQQQQNGGYSQGPQNGNGNGGYSQRPQNGNGNGHASNGHSSNGHSSNGHSSNGHSSNGHSSAFQSAPEVSSPPPAHNNGGGNGNGYSEAGRYIPAVAPGPIRSPSDVPSSDYGVPL